MPRLWRKPGETGAGVPPEGELFTKEDAARLVGSGAYTRTDPRKPRRSRKRRDDRVVEPKRQDGDDAAA